MSNQGARRLGVFGGSFDPVHLGHLLAAQDACEQMKLDRVMFMPTAQAPLKDRFPGAPAAMRLELLRAAVEGDRRFEVSLIELQRGGVSYTIDTARALRRSHPEDAIFWIIGADQAEQLSHWRELESLAGMVEFIVLARPGYSAPADAATLPPGVRLHPVASHVLDISSSEVRRRVAAGLPVRYFLPAPVADRIEKERLYR